jgi:hypothetical protein
LAQVVNFWLLSRSCPVQISAGRMTSLTRVSFMVFLSSSRQIPQYYLLKTSSTPCQHQTEMYNITSTLGSYYILL